MKKYLLITIFFMSLSLLFFSCEKDEDPPQPDFSASILSSTDSQITVSFTDLSSNSPDGWYWTFEGGYPSTSTEQNPTVTYSTSGTFDVSLVAANGGGENEMILYDYVSIAKFNNPTWTDIEIEVNNETTTIPVDDYVLYGQINNTLMSYKATTSGQTSTGDQIGLEISWDNTVDLTEYSSWNLVITDDYVFFTITNTGSVLYPLYVNYGTSVQRVYDIIIENDGVKKTLGYYEAYYGMIVYAEKYYYDGAVSWTEGSNLSLPWLDNQGVNLTNDLKSKPEIQTVVKELKDKDGGILRSTGVK